MESAQRGSALYYGLALYALLDPRCHLRTHALIMGMRQMCLIGTSSVRDCDCFYRPSESNTGVVVPMWDASAPIQPAA